MGLEPGPSAKSREAVGPGRQLRQKGPSRGPSSPTFSNQEAGPGFVLKVDVGVSENPEPGQKRAFQRMLLFAPREDALAALSCADGQDPDLHTTPEVARMEVNGRVQGRRDFSRNFTCPIIVHRRDPDAPYTQARPPLARTFSHNARPCRSRAVLSFAELLRGCAPPS